MKIHWFRLSMTVVGLFAVCLSACSRDPNVRKQKYFESGQRYFEKGDYPAAAIQFQNAVQVDPAYEKAHYGLAQVYTRAKDWGNSYRELSRVLDLDPANYPAIIDISNLLIANGDLKEAQVHADYLLAHLPEDFRTHVLRGEIDFANGDLAGAARELQKAISLQSGQSVPYLDLALIQFRTNQFDSAEANFKQAVTIAPKSVVALLALGRYYQSQKRFSEAEQEFRRAIENEPKSTQALADMAGLYREQNKTAQAIEFLKRAKNDLPNDPGRYCIVGDFYFSIGDMEKAVTEYGQLYRTHPQDTQLKKRYVQLLLQTNRLSEARAVNDAILKAAPNDIDSLIDEARIETRDGHANEATETLQRVLQNDPDNGWIYYYLGNAYAQSGNLRQAENAWNQSIHFRPQLLDAYQALAAAAIRRSDMTGLQLVATELITAQPSLPEGYALRALSFVNRNRLAEAQNDGAKAREIGPSLPAGYISLGRVRMAQKRFDEAESYFRQALAYDPASFDALKHLMQVYVLENNADKAVSAARNQIAAAPWDANLYFLLATGLLERKDFGEAESMLKKSVDLDHGNIDAILQLARLQVDQHRNQEAMALCQRSVATNPSEPRLYVLLGQIYDSAKDWEKASSVYQKALDITPDDPLASNNLAYSMLQSGSDPELAVTLAQAARKKMPDSYNAADTLGWALYRKGNYGAAIDSFRRALALGERGKEDDPVVHYHLGLAYERAGQYALARQQMQRSLDLDASFSDAPDAKQRLSQLEK